MPKILIVGQGLAGTALAWSCIRRGLDFDIVDNGHLTSSSLAAAGLFNPLILKRRKLAWRAVEFMDAMKGFYRTIEQDLKTKFLHERDILRRLSSIEEANDWMALSGHSQMGRFIGEQEGAEAYNHIEAPFGFQRIKETGYLDVDEYLSSSRQYFESIACYNQRQFLESDLGFEENKITYQGGDYSQVVLAMGYVMKDGSEFFPNLAFSPAKGHTFSFQAMDPLPQEILNGPCFLIQRHDGTCRVGATYSWKNFNEQVETEEVEKLLGRLTGFVQTKVELNQSWAGVRPATKDRRPMLGQSSVDERVFLFNGLGSRAVMTAPVLAQRLLDCMLAGEAIWEESNIERFYD